MCKNIQNDILMQKKMHEIFIQEIIRDITRTIYQKFQP